MATPIIANALSNATLAATASSVQATMPVQPLAAVDITLRGAPVAADVVDDVGEFMNKLSSVVLAYSGKSIFNVSGTDLMRLGSALGTAQYKLINYADADGSIREQTVRIPLGRTLFDPNECFPAVNSGDLTLTLNYTADPTDFDTYTVDVHTLTLPGAAATRFLRANSGTYTPPATGSQSTDLPRTADILGVLINSAHAKPGDTTETWDTVSLIINELETYYQGVRAPFLRALVGRRLPPTMCGESHVHISDVAGMYTQFQTTLNQQIGKSVFGVCHYMDFDMLPDHSDNIHALGLNQLQLSFDILVAEAIGIIPVQLYTPAQFGVAPLGR